MRNQRNSATLKVSPDKMLKTENKKPPPNEHRVKYNRGFKNIKVVSSNERTKEDHQMNRDLDSSHRGSEARLGSSQKDKQGIKVYNPNSNDKFE